MWCRESWRTSRVACRTALSRRPKAWRWRMACAALQLPCPSDQRSASPIQPSPRESRTLQPRSCCQRRVDKPCCLPTGVATRHRPGNQNIWLHLSAASQQAALRTANAHKHVNAMSCDICPARYNPTLKGGCEAGGPAGSLIPGLPETLKGGSTHLLLQAHPCPGSSATFSNPG